MKNLVVYVLVLVLVLSASVVDAQTLRRSGAAAIPREVNNNPNNQTQIQTPGADCRLVLGFMYSFPETFGLRETESPSSTVLQKIVERFPFDTFFYPNGQPANYGGWAGYNTISTILTQQAASNSSKIKCQEIAFTGEIFDNKNAFFILRISVASDHPEANGKYWVAASPRGRLDWKELYRKFLVIRLGKTYDETGQPVSLTKEAVVKAVKQTADYRLPSGGSYYKILQVELPEKGENPVP